jgi:DNA-binding transcriptional MerR regulator
MSKALEAFRTISEVADDLDVPKHVLRFWEVKFPQIRPMKRGGGRRYYRPEDLVLLRGIQHLLHAEGYTIKGVQKILREQGVEQVKTHGQAGEAHGEAPPPSRAEPDPASGRKSKGTASSAASGRVRALPKAMREAGEARTSAVNAQHRAAIKAAIGELEACRGLLATARPSAPAAGSRGSRSARTQRSPR